LRFFSFNLETAVGMNREPREIRGAKSKSQQSLTTNRFTRWVNTASCPMCSPFAYFAVSTAEFEFKAVPILTRAPAKRQIPQVFS
jgi:hypothetical protein